MKIFCPPGSYISYMPRTPIEVFIFSSFASTSAVSELSYLLIIF